MDQQTRDLSAQAAEYYPQVDFEWLDGMKVRCKGATLRFTQGFDLRQPDNGATVLFKNPSFLGAYLELFKGMNIENMVEVGVLNGGSAIFFWNLLEPTHLCCIDIEPGAYRLTDYIEDQVLHDSISTYFSTDQGDRPRLREILDEQFGSEPLDLVIDDASHQYGRSLATFEVMFPRLRPGGIYVLEDYKVHLAFPAHERNPDADEPKLHQLVQELVNVSIADHEAISAVAVHHHFAVFTRGEADLDPDAFNMSAILDSMKEHLEP